MPAKVLIVDDSHVTREITKVYLLTLRVDIIEADNGTDALARIRDDRPALVIADLRMPGMDGTALCAAVQHDPAIAHIPVVIVTSSYTPDHVRRCLSAGAREVVAKPAQFAALATIVQRYT